MPKNSEPDPRDPARRAFLAGAGHGGATLDPMPVDASFRRYFRLVGSAPPMLLMDAPPPKEDVRPFIRMARHLSRLGLRAPRIYDHDDMEGFALIEDFGDDTFSRLLDSGADPAPLFAAATDVLARLHSAPDSVRIPVAPYDDARLLNEITELPDWYGLASTGRPVPPDARASFVSLWEEALAALPAAETGLVLLDYHPDNLMRLPGPAGVGTCGVLDFQDALIGPRPYDLLCLLQNERRGIDPTLSDRLYARYVAACPPADPDGFALWYRVLAAQRYTKVVGRFARLTLRDGRDTYLRYLPRVLSLLDRALEGEKLLAPIRAHLDRTMPAWRLSPPDNAVALRRRVASGPG